MHEQLSQEYDLGRIKKFLDDSFKNHTEHLTNVGGDRTVLADAVLGMLGDDTQEFYFAHDYLSGDKDDDTLRDEYRDFSPSNSRKWRVQTAVGRIGDQAIVACLGPSIGADSSNKLHSSTLSGYSPEEVISPKILLAAHDLFRRALLTHGEYHAIAALTVADKSDQEWKYIEQLNSSIRQQMKERSLKDGRGATKDTFFTGVLKVYATSEDGADVCIVDWLASRHKLAGIIDNDELRARIEHNLISQFNQFYRCR